MKIVFLVVSIIVLIYDARSQFISTSSTSTSTGQSGTCSQNGLAVSLNSATESLHENCGKVISGRVQDMISYNSAVGDSMIVQKFQRDFAGLVNRVQQCISTITDEIIKRNCEVLRAIQQQTRAIQQNYTSLVSRAGGNGTTCQNSIVTQAFTAPLAATSSISSDQSTATSAYITLFTKLLSCANSCTEKAYALYSTLTSCGTSTASPPTVTCVENALTNFNFTTVVECFDKTCTNASIEAALVNTTKVTGYIEATKSVTDALVSCTKTSVS